MRRIAGEVRPGRRRRMMPSRWLSNGRHGPRRGQHMPPDRLGDRSSLRRRASDFQMVGGVVAIARAASMALGLFSIRRAAAHIGCEPAVAYCWLVVRDAHPACRIQPVSAQRVGSGGSCADRWRPNLWGCARPTRRDRRVSALIARMRLDKPGAQPGIIDRYGAA